MATTTAPPFSTSPPSGGPALGCWEGYAWTRRSRRPTPQYLDPRLLDSMTQLMASFVMDSGRTFILRSIDSIELRDLEFPSTLWGQATLLDARDVCSHVGNVHVFDESGRTYVQLSGVAFTTLDDVAAEGDSPTLNLVVASNFTAEPLQDSLKFWSDYFGVATRIEFAPYNQVFQQLLDSGSAFRKNHDGINVILLGLEEWAGDRLTALDVLRDAAGDDGVGCVLLDVVTGHGSHADPAGALAEPLAALARDRPVIAHVCGTPGDPQDARRQAARLRESGVVVAPTNAAAARLAAHALGAAA